MRVLLFGGSGQVGRALTALLRPFCTVEAPGHAEAPFDDLAALGRRVRAAAPDVIVNCAAWNDVDGAERDEAGALRVNHEAVAVLGEQARALSAGLIHYSTDYVFDGEKDGPYGEDDPPSPLGAYARSKLLGERALVEMDAPAVILRTAWVYSLEGKGFLPSILAAARVRPELRVVCDQSGHPTWAHDLAAATATILHGAGGHPFAGLRDARGVYHAVGGGVASRFELASAALAIDPRRAEHVATRVLPVTAAEFPHVARRPRRIELSTARLQERFGLTLPPWRESLAQMLRQGVPGTEG